jgi:Xaa-Pro aminopeptidase
LLNAVRDFGLTKGRIAVDDPWISETLKAAGVNATFVPAENVLRRIRLGRSPTEVALMRKVAVQNAEAALAAARSVHAGMTFHELRANYYTEAAKRGHAGVFMVIDSVSAEPFNATFQEGTGFSIDCVSQMLHYHGDFARTIFVGEPPALLKRATEASALGWDAVREKLKPGLRYNEVRQIGRDALAKAGYGDFNVTFTPHSVGLFHTDEPTREDVPFLVKDNLKLVENMVLSVDCPVLMDGLGGTVHLEDLVLITSDGAELLNPSTDRVIMV